MRALIMVLAGVPSANAKNELRRIMLETNTQQTLTALLALTVGEFDERTPSDDYRELVRRWMKGEDAERLVGLNMKFAREFWEFCLLDIVNGGVRDCYLNQLRQKYQRDIANPEVNEEDIYASVFDSISDPEMLQVLARVVTHCGDSSTQLESLQLLTGHDESIVQLQEDLFRIAGDPSRSPELRKTAVWLATTTGRTDVGVLLARLFEEELYRPETDLSVCDSLVNALSRKALAQLIASSSVLILYLDRVSHTSFGPRALSNVMVSLAGSETVIGAEPMLLAFSQRLESPEIALSGVRAMATLPNNTGTALERVRVLTLIAERADSRLCQEACASVLTLSQSLLERGQGKELAVGLEGLLAAVKARRDGDGNAISANLVFQIERIAARCRR